MFGWLRKKKKPSREELIAQALENARGARERLGDETIQKIAESLRKKENSPTELAKAQIRALDKDKVADHIKYMIKEER